MKDFLRQNKLFFQLLLAITAFFGLNDWKTLHALIVSLNSNFDLPHTLLSTTWWLSEASGVPGGRLIFTAIIIGVTANAIFTIRNRNRPLTILRTDIKLEFENGGSRVVTTRRQLLHANRPEIAAYFMKTSLDTPGATFEPNPAGGPDVNAWLEHPSLTVRPQSIGRRGVRDVNLVYSSALPYSWILSLIPKWWLQSGPDGLPAWIARYLIVQHVQYTSLKEYDNDDAKYQATSTRYSHHKIVIALDFARDTGLRPRTPADIQVMRRISNAVSEEHSNPTPAASVYKIDIGSGMAKDEIITVTWARR